MSRRTGLGRHRGIADSAGDPLDGLVNLFDIGIVLAVAFLIAGLSAALDATARPRTAAGQHVQALQVHPGAPSASGHGEPVGTVYRLSNGQLVYVQKQRGR